MGLFTRFKKKKNKDIVTPKPKIALCLGGGGMRGFAHIGVLKAFEEEGLAFDLVVGTSIGSVVGGLYAAGTPISEIEAHGLTIEKKSLHSGLIIKPNDALKIGRIILDLIGDKNIEELKIPYACVAVDLIEGRQVIIDKGSLSEACSASSAVPILYKPVVKNGMHLVDGGLLNNIPADVCKMLGADKVVSVDVNPTRGAGTKELGIIDVAKGAFSIMSSNSSFMGLRNSDVLISVNTAEFSSASKDGCDEMILRGYNAAKEKMEEIRELFK